MSGTTRSEGEPHDRLTRLCAAMTEALEAHPEYGEGVKCIVFLDDQERGGLQLHGYEDDMEAMVNLFMHLRALFEANGKTLMFAPLAGGPDSSAAPAPSLMRRSLDELLRRYPGHDLLRVEWQIDPPRGNWDGRQAARWAGPWVLVDLGQPSEHIEFEPAWAVRQFAVFRATGDVFQLDSSGAVDDELGPVILGARV